MQVAHALQSHQALPGMDELNLGRPRPLHCLAPAPMNKPIGHPLQCCPRTSPMAEVSGIVGELSHHKSRWPCEAYCARGPRPQ